MSEFRAELAQQAEQARALEAEQAHRQRLEAERERPQRPEPEQAPLLEPLPAIEPRFPSHAETIQTTITKMMELLQAQREQSPAQEPPPQRSQGFDMEP